MAQPQTASAKPCPSTRPRLAMCTDSPSRPTLATTCSWWRTTGRCAWGAVLAMAAAACVSSKEISPMSLPPPISSPTTSTSTSTSASRLPPAVVPPVVIGGLRFQQRHGDPEVDGQVGGWLDAFDHSGRRLWTLKVYENLRKPGLEGDAQDIFFSSMEALPDARLRIVDESGRSWLVDIHARSVTAETPAGPGTGRAGLLTID